MVFGFGKKKKAELEEDGLEPAAKLKLVRELETMTVPPPARNGDPSLTLVEFGSADRSDDITLNGYCEVTPGLQGCRWEPISLDDELAVMGVGAGKGGKGEEAKKARPRGTVVF